jgi:hypothetical protein
MPMVPFPPPLPADPEARRQAYAQLVRDLRRQQRQNAAFARHVLALVLAILTTLWFKSCF